MGRVAAFGLGAFGAACGGFTIWHPDGAGLAIQFKEDFGLTFFVCVPNCLQLHNQRHTWINFDFDLLANIHPIEKGFCRQGAHRAVIGVTHGVIGKDLGIHQIPVKVFIIDRLIKCSFQFLALGL